MKTTPPNPGIPPEQLILPRRFAERLGFKPQYGNELVKTGRVVMAPDGKHLLLAESLARFEATKDPGKQAVADRHAATRSAQAQEKPEPLADSEAEEEPPTDGSARLYDYHGAKAKREHWAAEREQAAFRKEAGELCELTRVVAVFADAGATVRSRLEALPTTLAPQIAGRDEATCRAAIADQVEQALRDLESRFYAFTAGQPA
jgi:hypothetical protein